MRQPITRAACELDHPPHFTWSAFYFERAVTVGSNLPFPLLFWFFFVCIRYQTRGIMCYSASSSSMVVDVSKPMSSGHLEVNVGADQSCRCLELAVRVNLCNLELFRPVNLVMVCARYYLKNSFNTSLLVRQTLTNDAISLSPGAQTPFHWASASQPRLLELRR